MEGGNFCDKVSHHCRLEAVRLEEERRKLEEAEREFAVHIEELRRARDREEFERFMKARHNRPTGETS